MKNITFKDLEHIFPENTEINDKGHLKIGDYDLTDLVSKFGSPLYIYEENTIRNTHCYW